MDKKWKSNIYNSLKSVADLDYQKQTWFGNSKYVSSFNETINILYDDNSFEDFIENDYWKEKPETNELLNAFFELHNKISMYEEPESEDKIIEDSEWLSITKQANIVLQLWDTYNTQRDFHSGSYKVDSEEDLSSKEIQINNEK